MKKREKKLMKNTMALVMEVCKASFRLIAKLTAIVLASRGLLSTIAFFSTYVYAMEKFKSF